MPDLFQDRAEGRAGGGGEEGVLAPQFFAKIKINETKNNSKKIK